MISRRDWQLRQLGIIQWSLRRLIVLRAKIAISLPEHIRLLIVTDNTLPALPNPMLGDILRAFTVTPEQVLQVAPEHVIAILSKSKPCNVWWLGEGNTLVVKGAKVTTPTFNELHTNAKARRELWQQICTHGHMFFL